MRAVVPRPAGRRRVRLEPAVGGGRSRSFRCTPGRSPGLVAGGEDEGRHGPDILTDSLLERPLAGADLVAAGRAAAAPRLPDRRREAAAGEQGAADVQGKTDRWWLPPSCVPLCIASRCQSVTLDAPVRACVPTRATRRLWPPARKPVTGENVPGRSNSTGAPRASPTARPMSEPLILSRASMEEDTLPDGARFAAGPVTDTGRTRALRGTMSRRAGWKAGTRSPTAAPGPSNSLINDLPEKGAPWHCMSCSET